jgi:hypothetical protein
MSLMSRDEQEVGKVAAVMVDTAVGQVAFILLCRQPQAPDYRLIPLHAIARVSGDTVTLDIQSQEVDGLIAHQPA